MLDEKSAEYLYNKVRKTAKIRFNCSRRLVLHKNFAVWSVSIASTFLVIISLLDISKLVVSSTAFSVFQISLSIFILVYSILVGASVDSDGTRSMHQSGTELLEIAYQIKPCVGIGIEPREYDKFVRAYTKVLHDSGGTSQIDYEMMRAHYRAEYKVSWLKIASTRFRFLSEYWHYILFIAFLAGVIYYLVEKVKL